MNAFANPEEAMPYEYTEFPAPEKKKVELSIPEGVVVGEFKDYMEYQNEPHENLIPVVQPIILQDFKQVISTPQVS
jgi:hypothetical protein